MRIFRHDKVATADRGAVVAIGNFDGVHLGHQRVIGIARERARALAAPRAVLTFEPHPRSVFRPGDPPFRLIPFRVKSRRLEALGVDLLFTLHFDLAFAAKSAEAFIAEVLVEGIGAREVVAGYDFVFGHERRGDAALLRERGQALGFGVEIAGPVAAEDGIAYSSTHIREHLTAGRPRQAAALLGRFWEIDGRVERGDQRGRTIGFPTANIFLQDYLRPAAGVYAVRAGIRGGIGHPLARCGGEFRQAAHFRRQRSPARGPSLRLRRRALRAPPPRGADRFPQARAEILGHRRAEGADRRRCGAGAHNSGGGAGVLSCEAPAMPAA